jgi:hypothetical protein
VWKMNENVYYYYILIFLYFVYHNVKPNRIMNGSKMQKFIELWTNKKQTGDSALVQLKDTKMIYICTLNQNWSMHQA